MRNAYFVVRGPKSDESKVPLRLLGLSRSISLVLPSSSGSNNLHRTSSRRRESIKELQPLPQFRTRVDQKESALRQRWGDSRALPSAASERDHAPDRRRHAIARVLQGRHIATEEGSGMEAGAIRGATTDHARALVTCVGRMGSWQGIVSGYDKIGGTRASNERFWLSFVVGYGERRLVGSPRIWSCFIYCTYSVFFYCTYGIW